MRIKRCKSLQKRSKTSRQTALRARLAAIHVPVVERNRAHRVRALRAFRQQRGGPCCSGERHRHVAFTRRRNRLRRCAAANIDSVGLMPVKRQLAYERCDGADRWIVKDERSWKLHAYARANRVSQFHRAQRVQASCHQRLLRPHVRTEHRVHGTHDVRLEVRLARRGVHRENARHLAASQTRQRGLGRTGGRRTRRRRCRRIRRIQQLGHKQIARARKCRDEAVPDERAHCHARQWGRPTLRVAHERAERAHAVRWHNHAQAEALEALADRGIVRHATASPRAPLHAQHARAPRLRGIRRRV